MSSNRSAAGVTVFEGRIYVSGGHDGLQIFNSVSSCGEPQILSCPALFFSLRKDFARRVPACLIPQRHKDRAVYPFPASSHFESFYHCVLVPLSSELSHISGFSFCFSRLRFPNRIITKQTSQQGELVTRGCSTSSTRSALVFLKKILTWNRKN